MFEAAKKLSVLFNKQEKKKFILLFAMMIIAAIFETIGIGLIVPFVGVVTNADFIQQQAVLAYIYDLFNFQSTNGFIAFLVGILLLVFLLKNIYLLFFFYVQFRIILNQQVKLSRTLFHEYLTKPYTFHLQRNSADLLRNVNGEVSNVFQGIMMSSFQLATELLIVACILMLLFITAPLATLTAFIILTVSVLSFYILFRKKISHLGIEQQRVNGTMIKWVNQGLGASKEVKVSGKEAYFVNAYGRQSQIKANNGRYLKMLEQAPRLFIETILVFTVLVTMLIVVFQAANTTEIVSTMALFAMAAFRLMPSITRVMALITAIRVHQPALNVVYDDLFNTKRKEKEANETDEEQMKTVRNNDKRSFVQSLQLNDVSYRYPMQEEWAVKNVSLTIPIGESAAFVGASGAGKTTIVDILLGLLIPEKGSVLIDGKELKKQKSLWQQKIGYIPQFIFLSDDTIRKNVAFGYESHDIKDDDVWRALEQAQLKEFVEQLPDQLETNVGERGVKLSGGQRQRIGIARALYTNPEILFMDEATSALDTNTEKEIMKAVDGLKGEKTLIIIAHRLSTIENCNITFKVNKGRLVKVDQKSESIREVN